jgi:hypothetical protein
VIDELKIEPEDVMDIFVAEDGDGSKSRLGGKCDSCGRKISPPIDYISTLWSTLIRVVRKIHSSQCFHDNEYKESLALAR